MWTELRKLGFMMGKIEVLDLEAFATKNVSKGSNICNQTKVIKVGDRRGESLGEKGDLEGGEKLGREVNNKVGRGVRIGISVRGGGLKFGRIAGT